MARTKSLARFDECVTERKSVCDCAECGGDVYAGDDVRRTADGIVHAGCFGEYAEAVLVTESGTIDEFGAIN